MTVRRAEAGQIRMHAVLPIGPPCSVWWLGLCPRHRGRPLRAEWVAQSRGHPPPRLQWDLRACPQNEAGVDSSRPVPGRVRGRANARRAGSARGGPQTPPSRHAGRCRRSSTGPVISPRSCAQTVAPRESQRCAVNRERSGTTHFALSMSSCSSTLLTFSSSRRIIACAFTNRSSRSSMRSSTSSRRLVFEREVRYVSAIIRPAATENKKPSASAFAPFWIALVEY